MLNTPVVLIAFNRTAVTRRNLEAIAAVRPRELYLVVDGPRPHRPDDERSCAEVRELLDDVDWAGTVHRRYAETNLGLEANVELGLDWVFSKVDRAIVLEDDCIPDPTFFAFCEELLQRYEDDPRIWQVAGDNHGVPTEMFGPSSYAFSTWASVWGWATWADRWVRHRAGFPRDHRGAEVRAAAVPRTAPAVRPVPVEPDPSALVTGAARSHFSFVASCEDGDAYGWDHHWWVTIMAARGLSVVPAVTMIENDGYGEGATHTRAGKDPVPATPMRFPLVHPSEVVLHREIEAELELILLRTDGRLSRLVRKLVRPLWMRALVRRVVANRIVWRCVRRLAVR
jgi:hypothetical protein